MKLVQSILLLAFLGNVQALPLVLQDLKDQFSAVVTNWQTGFTNAVEKVKNADPSLWPQVGTGAFISATEMCEGVEMTNCTTAAGNRDGAMFCREAGGYKSNFCNPRAPGDGGGFITVVSIDTCGCCNGDCASATRGEPACTCGCETGGVQGVAVSHTLGSFFSHQMKMKACYKADVVDNVVAMNPYFEYDTSCDECSGSA